MGLEPECMGDFAVVVRSLEREAANKDGTTMLFYKIPELATLCDFSDEGYRLVNSFGVGDVDGKWEGCTPGEAQVFGI